MNDLIWLYMSFHYVSYALIVIPLCGQTPLVIGTV